MLDTKFWLVVVLIYYFIATFVPIDKVIGKIYPVFGICLIVMALGEMCIRDRRRPMNANVSKLLNEQINKEFYSAYLYLDCLLYTSRA